MAADCVSVGEALGMIEGHMGMVVCVLVLVCPCACLCVCVCACVYGECVRICCVYVSV